MLNGARLEGKVALVTGASRGIGEAIAIRLAQEGADVAVNYQNAKDNASKVELLIQDMARTDELEELSMLIDLLNSREQAREIRGFVESLGRHSSKFQANVADYGQVQRMVEQVNREFGRLDILVNNAGITRDKSFAQMTPEMWQEVLQVNLTGTFNCTKAAIDGMLARKYGRIINISSVIGRMGNRGQANYAASKAGIIGMTQTLAKEFASKGITVNAIAPGFVETDMLKSIPKDIMQKIIAQIPSGRLCAPAEVAAAVVYLASRDGDYITGQVLDINGGLYM